MIDICVTIIRQRRNTDRAVGDVFRVWEIGDDPSKDQFPATLESGPPKAYTPKESIDPGTRMFCYVFCTNVPAAGVNRCKHWAGLLMKPDPGTWTGPDSTPHPDHKYVKRHKARLVLTDLPAPRTAELNTNNFTTVTWATFRDAMRIKQLDGSERPADDNDL